MRGYKGNRGLGRGMPDILEHYISLIHNYKGKVKSPPVYDSLTIFMAKSIANTGH